ncbi:MAG: hypothetical protein IKA84_02795 [Clostridia bacterium]|nr:hypothetical protein [Clostridia bacterium]
MGNKSKLKNVIFSIVAMVLGALTIAISFVLGSVIKNETNAELFDILANICTALTFVILAINIIYRIVWTKKMQKMKVAEVNEMMLRRKENIKENFELATARLRKTSTFCKLYVVFITIFMHITAFLLGASLLSTRYLLYLIFMTGGVYIRLIGVITDKEKFKPEEFLSRKDYAELYSIAEEAMAKAGVDGRIYIASDNSFNAGIAKEGDTYMLLLGAIMVNSLSREELFNVLLHEFAHHSKEYTPKSTYGFFNRFIEHETDGSTITDIIISLPMMKYGEEFLYYTLLASEYIEGMADSVTIKNGNPKAFISALAKCNFYDSYDKVLFKYQSKPMFESDTVTQNVATLNFEAFVNSVKDNGEKWLSSYEKEIQPRNATHPIYRLRRDAIGVKADEVAWTLNVNGDGLDKERAAILQYVDADIVKHLSANYEELRKENYLKPLSIINGWENNKDNYSSAELIPVIDALAGLLRFDEAEALCDKIIAEEENKYATAYPKHFKGSMLLLRDDPAGIDLLYEAIELNSNLLEISINQIGEFACRNGMQDELDKYREKAVSMTQKMIDEDEKANVLTQSDKVVEDDMREDVLKAHIDFISSVSGSIKSIYLLKKVINESFSSHVFLIEFEKDTTPDTINESMNKIFRYLDTLDDEQYSLFLYNKLYKNIVKKVKNAQKYSKE